MREFIGMCRGGPLDGKQLAHTAKIYEMVISELIEPRIGLTAWKTARYTWVADQWIWRDD